MMAQYVTLTSTHHKKVLPHMSYPDITHFNWIKIAFLMKARFISSTPSMVALHVKSFNRVELHENGGEVNVVIAFCAEFIATMPPEGGIICKQEIINWIIAQGYTSRRSEF